MSHRIAPRTGFTFSLLLLIGCAVGCAGKEFRAYDGAPDPKSDVRLTINDSRIRIVSANGVTVPDDFRENVQSTRTLWVRGTAGAAIRLTLGIGTHDAVVNSHFTPATPQPAPTGGGTSLSIGSSGTRYVSTVRYPGSNKNQAITFTSAPAARYTITLNGELDAAKKAIWGFTVTDDEAKSPVTLRSVTWQAHPTGVDATPWNLWALPDDALEMKTNFSY